MRVKSQSGENLTVRRRWMPWRRLTRGGGYAALGADTGIGTSSILELVFSTIGVVALVIVALVVAEVALLLALFPVAIGARTLLRRPWTIEVRNGPWWGDTLLQEHQVVGWRESSEAIKRIATELATELPKAVTAN